MRRVVVAATAAAVAAGVALIVPFGEGQASPPNVRAAAWKPCAEQDLAKLGLQCANIQVPVDYAKPSGRKITLAASRKPATAKTKRGTLLVNPGGPGAAARLLPGSVAAGMPEELAASYDIVAVDPRGVGGSKPTLSCDADFFKPAWKDPVPASRADETAMRQRTAGYVAACTKKFGWLLPHMGSANTVRDMETVRTSLGAKKLSYIGYGYGGYLGALYGSRYPGHVDKLVLDSTQRIDGDWYKHYFEEEDLLFDSRADDFFDWLARYDKVYGLGTDAAAVKKVYYDTRAEMAKKPAAGIVGPFEFEGDFHNVAWDTGYWIPLANALAAYVHDGNEDGLAQTYEAFAAHHGDNDYAAFTATQCADMAWPRDWRTWHRDTARIHATKPFAAWNNTWYLSPCSMWPVRAGHPTAVNGAKVPASLIVHGTNDAAMAYEWGEKLHASAPRSRMVTEKGGMSPAVSLLRGNSCVDKAVIAYLSDGTLPASKPGTDVVCGTQPEPDPSAPPPPPSEGAGALSGVGG